MAATTNYLLDTKGGPFTMTTPAAESYLGFLTQSTSSLNITLYNGSTSLGEVTATQLAGAAAANGYAWINIDVANGGTYTSAVFSETNPNSIVDRVFEISYGTTSESLNAAPLPALAGTQRRFRRSPERFLDLRQPSWECSASVAEAAAAERAQIRNLRRAPPAGITTAW